MRNDRQRGQQRKWAKSVEGVVGELGEGAVEGVVIELGEGVVRINLLIVFVDEVTVRLKSTLFAKVSI